MTDSQLTELMKGPSEVWQRSLYDEYCAYGEFTGTMVGLTCADRVG